VVGQVQVPKSPQGEASGVPVAGAGPKAERTLSGFPCQLMEFGSMGGAGPTSSILPKTCS
jgi:hypothetical protein